MQSSSKVEEEEEDDEKKVITLEKLHQQFLNVQQEWDNFKKYSSNSRSRSRSSRPFRRSSKFPANDRAVQSSTSSTTTLNLPHVNNIDIISPRNLMSSLQTNTSSSPSSEMWKVNDLAVKEILTDRREAIERGSLKGRRRLFDSQVGLGEDQAQEISVMSFNENDNDDDDDDEDPFGSRDDYDADHVPFRFEEREMAAAEKMSVGDSKAGRSYDMVIKRWIVVVCVIFAIFIIRSFGEFRDDNNKVILVPT